MNQKSLVLENKNIRFIAYDLNYFIIQLYYPYDDIWRTIDYYSEIDGQFTVAKSKTYIINLLINSDFFDWNCNELRCRFKFNDVAKLKLI